MTAATYHRTGGEALQELRSKLEVGLLGFLAWRAGRNYYNMHPDFGDAVIHGATALRRWWVWLFFVKVWIFSVLFLCWMLWLRFHDIRGESFVSNSAAFDNVTYTLIAFLPLALLGLLVVYCRNVDFSLFKRRLVYRVLRPLVAVLDRVPAWAFYLIVPCALFFPTGWFITDDGGSDWTPGQIAAQAEWVCEKVATARDNGQPTVTFDPQINLSVLDIGDDFQGWYIANC